MLDPMTGETLRELKLRKVNCVRMTSSPGMLFCRGEGLGKYDLRTDKYTVDGSARPGCNAKVQRVSDPSVPSVAGQVKFSK